MRTALAALTLTVAGFVIDPDRAYAQEAGQLRVTVRLTDAKARMTYPVGSLPPDNHRGSRVTHASRSYKS